MTPFTASAIRHCALAGSMALAGAVFAQASVGVEVSDPPADHDFGRIPIGATYATQYFSVFNHSQAPVTLGTARIDSELATCMAIGCPQIAPADFEVFGSDGCSGTTLAPGAGCSTQIRFLPTQAGPRTARLSFPVLGQTAVERIIRGTGRAVPTDCVLDWAERQLPTLLTQPTPTLTVGPFHARCYQGGTSLCLGADSALPTFAPASVYALMNGQLIKLPKTLAELAAEATHPPPSTVRCDQPE